MATNRPRLTVSLSPRTYATIKKLAKYQKRPASSIINEAMNEMQPIMAQLVALMDKAHSIEKEMFRPFADEVADLHNDAQESRRIFEEILAELDAKLESRIPPASNTGVKSPETRMNTQKRKKKKCTKPRTKKH